MKISKTRLKEIIKEELSEASEASIRADLDRPAGVPRSPEEMNTFEMSVDELATLAKKGLRQVDAGLLDIGSAQARLVEQHDAGEFVHLKTQVNELYRLLDLLGESFTIALGRYEERR